MPTMMKTIFFVVSLHILLGNLAAIVTAENEPDDTPNPALTCAVLGSIACDRMCRMMGRVYGTPVNPGTCDSYHSCDCTARQHLTVRDLWTEKFDSDDILNELTNNWVRYQAIQRIIRTQGRTREQTKQDLKPYLSAAQFENLHVNDNIAEYMILQNDRIDKEAVKKYVSEDLKSTPFETPDNDFKTNFMKTLETTSDQDIVQYMIEDVRNSKNPVLNNLVDTFITQKDFKEDASSGDENEEDDTLTDILDMAIVNEFISQASATPSQDEEATQKDSTAPEDIPEDEDRWDLPNFDKSILNNFTGYNCWDGDGSYDVCLFRTYPKENRLWWNKGNDRIYVYAGLDGDAIQQWDLADGVDISLSKQVNGDVSQVWKFNPDTELHYIKFANGTSEQTWKNDKEDQVALNRYKRYIASWCNKNDFFIGKELCVIY